MEAGSKGCRDKALNVYIFNRDKERKGIILVDCNTLSGDEVFAGGESAKLFLNEQRVTTLEYKHSLAEAWSSEFSIENDGGSDGPPG